MDEPPPGLIRFVKGECDPDNFPHGDHVRMAFEMLRRHSFPETALHYSFALRSMAARAGRPEAYHETITLAFLSLIAERADAAGAEDYATFARGNPDLFDKRVLARWYDPARLASDAARRMFLLPEPRL
jgi:hypothetical protein